MALMNRRDVLTALSSLAATSAVSSVTNPLQVTVSTVVGSAESDFVTIPTTIYSTPEAPDGLFPITYRKLLPVTAARARYPEFKPGQWTLKAGTVRRQGARTLTTDIIFERDVATKLRDGTTIYTDIFRPAHTAKVPAIFSWSPYGTAVGGQWLDDLPSRSGAAGASLRVTAL